MLKYISLTIFFLFNGIIFSQSIELVESIPSETNLDNPDIRNTQEVWLEIINNCQKTLDIEQFYISNEKGEALDTVINSIIDAANRGVRVRILIDAGMYKTYPETADSLAKVLNIKLFPIDYKKIAGGILHSKYMIADDSILFLGSQNFDWRSLKHIHELGLKIISVKVVENFKSVFSKDWISVQSWQPDVFFPYRDSVFKIITSEGINFIKTMSNPKDGLFFWDLKGILNLINSSKSEINLQYLTYSINTYDNSSSWYEIDSAIIRASQREVKVKLIVSDWNLGEKAVTHFKEMLSNPNIEVRYTSIPEYSGGYIPFARVEHCKFIIVDKQKFWLGSSNMEKSYYYNSRNIGIIVENKKLAEKVSGIFYKSWDGDYSHKITPEGTYKPRYHSEK